MSAAFVVRNKYLLSLHFPLPLALAKKSFSINLDLVLFFTEHGLLLTDPLIWLSGHPKIFFFFSVAQLFLFSDCFKNSDWPNMMVHFKRSSWKKNVLEDNIFATNFVSDQQGPACIAFHCSLLYITTSDIYRWEQWKAIHAGPWSSERVRRWLDNNTKTTIS